MYPNWLIIVFATTIAAQSISDIPACAQQCLTNGVSSSGCNAIDIKCVCASTGFLEHLAPCVIQHCSQQERVSVANFAMTLCSGVGVTLPSDIISSVTAAGAVATTFATASTSLSQTFTITEEATASAVATASTTAPTASTTTVKTSAATYNSNWSVLLGIALFGFAF